MPLFRFSRPLLVLFDEERLAFVVLSTPPETAEGVLSEKPTTFATNSTTFTQKSTGFSHFFWPMGAQRPTIGEKFTARERMRHKQGDAFHGFSDRGGCFSAHRPSFRRERGAMFLPYAHYRRQNGCRREGKGEGGRKCRRGGAEARAERRGHKGTKKRRQT